MALYNIALNPKAKSAGGDIVVVDVPGFGEADAPLLKMVDAGDKMITLTYSVVQVANELFAKGKFPASQEELREYAQKHVEEGRRAAEASSQSVWQRQRFDHFSRKF